MADESALLKILVQLGVVGQADVVAAKQLLEETGEAGKESMKGMSESMPANLAAWKNYSKGLGETRGDSESLRESLHGLSGAARLGGLSEFAHLAHAALNPVSLTVGALAIGLETYFKWQERVEEKHKQMIMDLEQVNQKQREMIAAGPSVAQLWLDQIKLVAQLRAEYTGLGAQLKHFEETAKVYDLAAKDALDARLNGRERELTLIEEQITLLEQLGVITKEQADLREGDVEHQKKIDAINADVEKKKADAAQAKTNYDAEVARAGGEGAFTPEALAKKQGDMQTADEAVRRATSLATDTPAQIAGLQQKIEEWKGAQKKPENVLDWNTYTHSINEARDEIKLLREQSANATTNLPALMAQAAQAKEQFETLKGLHDKFETMSDNIRELTQKVIDAQAAQPKQVSDENMRFAIAQFQTILKDSGLNPDQIISQGASGADDIKNLIRNGFTPDRIKTEGEDAQRQKAAGQTYNAAAIARLEELQRDQTEVDRLNALLASMGQNSARMIQFLQQHSNNIISQSQEIAQLQNYYAAMMRGNANGRPVS